MVITGASVEQREDAAYVTLYTRSGFRVWLVQDGQRTLLEDIDLEP